MRPVCWGGHVLAVVSSSGWRCLWAKGEIRSQRFVYGAAAVLPGLV